MPRRVENVSVVPSLTSALKSGATVPAASGPAPAAAPAAPAPVPTAAPEPAAAPVPAAAVAAALVTAPVTLAVPPAGTASPAHAAVAASTAPSNSPRVAFAFTRGTLARRARADHPELVRAPPPRFTRGMTRLAASLAPLLLALAAGCVGRATAGTTDSAGGGSSDSAPGSGTDAAGPGSDAAAACPAGVICVGAFPFHDDNDTSASTARALAGYSCDPTIDESGPEVVYRVVLPADGFLSAAVDDSLAGVDVDLHILSALDAAACLDRGNFDARAHLTAGTYYVVADTWVSATAGEQSGPYAIDIGYVVPPPGDCTMTVETLVRIVGAPLDLPATGPVVKEAHLVTTADGFGAAWPTSITDGIPAHYATSFGLTDFVMHRTQPWAPMESSQFGQGASGAPLPPVDEGWYVNMYWADRPPGGTRMIVRLPGGGPAVVAAAGYETGPGDPTHIAGVTEEVHFYLGTAHLDTLTVGFAVDQTLPLGPIACE